MCLFGMERGWKPTAELSPACPRCGSANTKFCYYNNYSLTQPRYFCKGCRRYWTRGGSLRNVPIGGGCRKSRRGKSVRAASVDGSRNTAYDQVERSSVSDGNEASTSGGSIDLAAVYANFLNQSPRPQNQIKRASELHEGVVIPPSIEFPNFQMSNHFPQEINGRFPVSLWEAQLFGHGCGNPVFSEELDEFQKQQFPTGSGFMSINPIENDMLPPLPDVILHSDEPIGGEIQSADEQNQELVNGNMSMFSRMNIEAIFRS